MYTRWLRLCREENLLKADKIKAGADDKLLQRARALAA